MTENTLPARYRVRIFEHINEVDASVWDACAGQENPFLAHGFFSALEESGSLSAKTGFQARHLLLEDLEGKVLGAVPQYLRHHAYAGHGPDADWIGLFQERGLKYFPKLQVEIPYVPQVGERLLVAPGQNKRHIKKILVSGLKKIAQQFGLNSLQAGFVNDEDRDHFADAGFTTSLGLSHIWRNRDYKSFEEFLFDLQQKKRGNIRTERRRAHDGEIRIQRVFGSCITPGLWRAFYQFHLHTNRQYKTRTYLNEEFFVRLGSTFQDRLYIALAIAGNKPVAGTLHIIGRDFVLPRYWGSLEKARHLHFECSYHNAIEYAIEHKISRIDAGPGGDHKINRGFLPEITRSVHYFPNPEIHSLIKKLVRRRNMTTTDLLEHPKVNSPYLTQRTKK